MTLKNFLVTEIIANISGRTLINIKNKILLKDKNKLKKKKTLVSYQYFFLILCQQNQHLRMLGINRFLIKKGQVTLKASISSKITEVKQFAD